MRVLAKRVLREFWLKHSDSKHQLNHWFSEASKAQWSTPNDIKSEYPSASILKNGRIVFNICRNKYRLVVDINYTRRWIFIKFIGTHKEYDIINVDKI